MRLTETRVRGGVWEGLLAVPGAAAAPVVEVVHGGRAVPGLTVEPLPGAAGVFALRVPIPVEIIADGVETLLIRTRDGGETIGHIAVAAGSALDTDLRAEVDLLRAELDLLKRAFRRHCLETAGKG